MKIMLYCSASFVKKIFAGTKKIFAGTKQIFAGTKQIFAGTNTRDIFEMTLFLVIYTELSNIS